MMSPCKSPEQPVNGVFIIYQVSPRPAVSPNSLHLQVHLPPTPPPHTTSWPRATQCVLAVPTPSHPA